jgi:hypothetical protein
VETRWDAVARGEVSRESISAWAEPLMFADYSGKPDLLMLQALQYLHGFDMTRDFADGRLIGHGAQGPYERTLEQVAEELDAWRDRCDAYDADPEGWVAERRREAEAYVRRERGQK